MTWKILLLALLLIGLAGCNERWSEATERAACNLAFPMNSAKAQECYNGRKLAYDERRARLRNGEWK